MTINQVTSALYAAARLLRWAKAGKRSVDERSLAPIAKRVGRVVAGRAAGSIINKVFKP
jgi:hypothetical protein